MRYMSPDELAFWARWGSKILRRADPTTGVEHRVDTPTTDQQEKP